MGILIMTVSMQKIFTAFLLLIPSILCSQSVQGASLFRSRYVCAPKINPTISGLEFRIRDSAPCGPDEIWMQVARRKDGILYLYPIEPPLAKEAEEDLEAFKKYNGIER